MVSGLPLHFSLNLCCTNIKYFVLCTSCSNLWCGLIRNKTTPIPLANYISSKHFSVTCSLLLLRSNFPFLSSLWNFTVENIKKNHLSELTRRRYVFIYLCSASSHKRSGERAVSYPPSQIPYNRQRLWNSHGHLIGNPAECRMHFLCTSHFSWWWLWDSELFLSRGHWEVM